MFIIRVVPSRQRVHSPQDSCLYNYEGRGQKREAGQWGRWNDVEGEEEYDDDTERGVGLRRGWTMRADDR